MVELAAHTLAIGRPLKHKVAIARANCGYAGVLPGLSGGEVMQESLCSAIPCHGQRSPRWPQNDPARAWEAPRAFEEWVLTYQAELFSFVCGAIGDQNDADGIAVEAFAQVHALAYQGRIQDTSVAELYRIAIRESARRLFIRPRTHHDERRQFVWRILMRLDENARLLLLLREAAGYSVPQIAACLRISEEQVRSRLLAARQSFLAARSGLDGTVPSDQRRPAQ